jgi:hypothetical protein
VTSAAAALAEERPAVLETVTPVVELKARGGFSTKFALATIGVVEAGWLATLGYFAVVILH